MRLRLAVSSLVLFLCVEAHSAEAQVAEISPEERQDARHWAAEGNEHYIAEEYQRAYEAFYRVSQLIDLPGVKYNMARCLSRLGRFSEAIVLFSDVMADPSFTAGEPQREIDLAREGQAKIVFDGAQGTVRVGSQSCESPCELSVDPGSHEYTFDGERRALELSRGERREIPLLLHAPEFQRGPYRPGWGTAIGLTLAGVGGVGVIGFGLRTEFLADEVLLDPRQELVDQGIRSRRLTNASIALAGLGVAIFLTEVLVKSLRRHPVRTSPGTQALVTW